MAGARRAAPGQMAGVFAEVPFCFRGVLEQHGI
jgi:hypothetical protein